MMAERREQDETERGRVAPADANPPAPTDPGPVDLVEEESQESFPASDPPSFTPTNHPGPPAR